MSFNFDIQNTIIEEPKAIGPFAPDAMTDEIASIFSLEADKYDYKDWRWKPVTIQEWITGEEYLNLSQSIRKVVYEDVCEFFKTKSMNPFDRYYDEAVLCCGIGSGKSFATSIIITYFQHLMLCLRNPQKFLGIDKATKIVILNMSVSEKNAKKVIFSDVMAKIKDCKWFNDKPYDCEDARMPDPNCLSELRFKNNTIILPGSSSWRSAVGYAIVVGVIDEAGAYRNTDNSDQAGDIYNALQRRLGSRFESKGAIIIAGSPLYEHDFLEQKVKEGERLGSRVLSRRRSTWESKHPDYEGEHFYMDLSTRQILDVEPKDMKSVIKIPKIDYLYKSFTLNPTKALRDLGARPSASINTFFENPRIILDKYNRARTEDPVDKNGTFKESFKCIDPNAFHAIHIDLGLTSDACGFCLGHHAGYTDEGSIKIYIDLVMRFQGTKESPVQISKVRDYIYTLTAMGFPISVTSFDSFASQDSFQLLEKKGYRVEYISVDRTMLPYQHLKETLIDNRLDYYYIPSGDVDYPSASEVLARELMQLEEIDGKKVDHPPGPDSSKDISDSVAGVVHSIIENGQYLGQLQVEVL